MFAAVTKDTITWATSSNYYVFVDAQTNLWYTSEQPFLFLFALVKKYQPGFPAKKHFITNEPSISALKTVPVELLIT